jgi:tetratricopeptide (TPR) repeat protein
MPPLPPTAPDRPRTLDEALHRAAEALRLGAFQEAERLAAYVLKSNPGHAGAARLMGQALLQLGRAKEAVSPLRRATRKTEEPVLETLLALALEGAGQGAAALEVLRLAVSRRPPYPVAFLELGDRLTRAGRFDDAIEVFQEGLVLAPDAVVLRVGLGHAHLGRGDRAGARAAFSAARVMAPDRRDAAVGLGHLAAQEGDHAAAAAFYRQALAARPDDFETRVSLARSQLELGERAAGEALLREAAQAGDRAAGLVVTALASTPHGRAFLRPSLAARFLKNP